MAIERDLRQSGRTASVDRTSIRPTRVSRLILGLAIIYVSAGSSPNVSLTAKPRVILMPNRSLPASERLDPFPGEAGSLLQRAFAGVSTAIRSRYLERIGK